MAHPNQAVLATLAGAALLTMATPLLLASGATSARSESLPEAVCTQMIYSGSTPKAVVHTSHDVVVGPVRFGDLDPRAIQRIAGSRQLGIKSPMTIGSTPFKTLIVSAVGQRSAVGVSYGQVPSTTTTSVDLAAESDRVLAQAPATCGLPSNGFVQYGGGFSLAREQCVTLTVSLPTGRVLARRTVPFGSSVSCRTAR
jgi:hypothetical protein